MPELRVPFGDLKRAHLACREELDAAFARVLDSGWFVLGPEVTAFEREFSSLCGAAHTVGVASGADALYLALAALDIGAGDEVITVANACMYQVAAIVQTGATPVLVDVDVDRQTMNPSDLEAAVSPRTRAIIPVHLYGRLADMPAICAIARRHGIAVVEDAAQAIGSFAPDDDGRLRAAGTWGISACFSFYPSKNLGALGDAGAIVSNDALLTERLRRLRMYGWESKYNTVDTGGRNSRLDELQAALLRVKVPYLVDATHARRERAAWYAELLADLPLVLPPDEPGHTYHLYVVTLPTRAQRDALRTHLTSSGIGCDVHYPTPAYLQPAFAHLGYGRGALPVTETLADRILSLPMFPELTRNEIEQVAAAVKAGVH